MKKIIRIIIAAADIILLGVFIGVLLYCQKQINTVSLQPAADIWDGGTPGTSYSVISLSIDRIFAKNLDSIYELKKAVTKKLTDLSIPETTPEGNKSYTDCWYGSEITVLTSPKGKVTVRLYYVGGDFFTVHLPRQLSGSTFSADDINIDGIVLDENASWQLYGSRCDTEGMTVFAGDTELVVTGVIAAPTEKGILKSAYDDLGMPCAYVPYQASANVKGDSVKFTGYDALLPDNVKSFAENVVKGAAGINETTTTMYVSDSRSRYRLEAIRDSSKHMERFVSRSNTAELPYWEIAAQDVMLRLTVSYRLCIGLLVPLIISAGYWLVLFYLLLVRAKNRVVTIADRKIENRKMERYLRKQKEKQEKRAMQEEAERKKAAAQASAPAPAASPGTDGKEKSGK